jgi:hypothetical protein
MAIFQPNTQHAALAAFGERVLGRADNNDADLPRLVAVVAGISLLDRCSLMT